MPQLTYTSSNPLDQKLFNESQKTTIFTASTAQEIQRINDNLVLNNQKGVIQLVSDMPILLYRTLKIDIHHTTLDGAGAILDASQLIDNVAIHITSHKHTPGSNTQSLCNLELQGPSADSNKIGLYFQSERGAVYGFSLHNVLIRGFGIGEKYSKNTYLIKHYNTHVTACGIGVFVESASNSGENITRFGGVIANSYLAVHIEHADADLYFHSTSIDYCQQFFDIINGRVQLFGCHLEGNNANRKMIKSPIQMTHNGAHFMMYGGNISIGISNEWPHYDTFIHVDNHASAVFDGVYMHGVSSQSGYFASGENAKNNVVLVNISQVSGGANLLLLGGEQADSGFDRATIIDSIFIQKDAETIVHPHQGTNLNLELSTEKFKTGHQSLKITKLGAKSTSAQVVIASVPVSKYQRAGWDVTLSLPEGVDGYFSCVYAIMPHHNTPSTRKIEYYQDVSSIRLQSTGEWQQLRGSTLNKKSPPWATHAMLLLNLDGWDAKGQSIYIDNVQLEKMG